MDDEKASTGSKDLDEALKVLLDLASSDRLLAVKRAIADRSLRLEDLRKLLPDDVIRLALVLTTPAAVEKVTGRSNEAGKKLIERAKQIIDEHLAGFGSHPAVAEFLREDYPRASAEAGLENRISGIASSSGWMGKPPELQPFVRIRLKASGGKHLLDTAADWDDLAFLVKGFATVLKGQMEEAVQLAKHELLDTSAFEGLGRKLREAEETLRRIRELAPRVGLDLDRETDEAEASAEQ